MTEPRGSSASPPRQGRLSRRVFLVALAGAASAAGVGALLRARWGGLRGLEDRVRHARRIRARLGLDLDASSGVGELTAAEVQTLAALSDVLLPSRLAGNDEARRTIEEVALELARDVPGQRLELQRGVALLDERGRRQHGRDFASLSLAERRALFDEIVAPMVRSGAVGKGLRYVFANGRDVWRLWRFVARGLMVGFYASPFGWRLVGYAPSPGSCPGLDYYQGPPPPLAGS